MRSDSAGKTSSTRQKATIFLFVIIVVVILWQVKSMIGLGSSKAATPAVTTGAAQPPPLPPPPQPAQLTKEQPAPLTPREMELIQLQQQTEAKYVAAVNDLQMLKVQRDIAETNRAIASAKLDTVKNEKDTIDLLIRQNQVNLGGPSAPPQQAQANPPPAQPVPAISLVNYAVVSITQLNYKWGAVLSNGTNLFNVAVGDVLPDGSTVTAIDRGGLFLEKSGMKRRVSLLPII